MPQVTIYLDDETFQHFSAASEASGLSKSQWIADAIRLRMRKEWPAEVRSLAGAWRNFPTAEQIRKKQPPDARRERL